MSFTRRLLFAFSIVSLLHFTCMVAVHASDCTVADPGDAGAGTLRDCLDNVATTDGDIVTIPAMTIQLTSGELYISHPLTIQGAGAVDSVIDASGNGNGRVFRVNTNTSGDVILQGLTIRGAHSDASGAGIYVLGTGLLRVQDSLVRDNEASIASMALDQGGGGIFVGGNALLVLQNSEVSENIVNGNGTGGGILSTSNLLLIESRIASNDALDTLAGVGGVDSKGVAQVLNSTFFENQGIFVGGGSFRSGFLLNMLFEGNLATTAGGGLALFGEISLHNAQFSRNRVLHGVGGGLYACGDNITVSNATFERNQALDGGHAGDGFGGGIFNCGVLELNNVTLFNNEAQGSGAAIANDVDATLTLLHGSVFANTADSDNGGATSGEGGGIFNRPGGSLDFANSIIAGNADLSGGGDDCFNLGILSAQGKNILQDPVGCEAIFSTLGAVENADPVFLGTLGENGGQATGQGGSQIILTLALDEGSPAVDRADSELCLEDDARAVQRPQGAGCDMGAYEWAPMPTPLPTESPATTPVPQASPEASSNPSVPGPAGGPSAQVSGGGCAFSGVDSEPDIFGLKALGMGIAVWIAFSRCRQMRSSRC